MAEEYTLTAPEVVPQVTNTKYKIVYQSYDWMNSWIMFRLQGENGEQLTPEYGGLTADQAGKDAARDMMKYLNTANNTTKSQQKRILEKLQKDGKIPNGTVTGTPDPPPVVP